MKRLIGLDIGDKNIGIAVSDGLGITAQALTTLKRKNINVDTASLKVMIEKYDVGEIIIGLPKNMDGSIGHQAKKVIHFTEQLKKSLNIPIIFWDERLTTVMATKVMIEGDLSRKKRKKRIDKIAAQLVLQNYLDRKKFFSKSEENEK
jgi:putative Holliday junction resolvase